MDRPVCIICNKTKVSIADYNKNGLPRYKRKCEKCSPFYKEKLKRRSEKMRTNKYGIYIKAEVCVSCNFLAIDSCQLDVDHIDGDHNNNSLVNLQTLCANCHRLKTKVKKEFGPKVDIQ